jgi:hypothetical protein
VLEIPDDEQAELESLLSAAGIQIESLVAAGT